MLDSNYKSKAIIYQLSENLHDYNLHDENIVIFCPLYIYSSSQRLIFQYFQFYRPLDTYSELFILTIVNQ